MTVRRNRKVAKAKKSKNGTPAPASSKDMDQLRRGMPALDNLVNVEDWVSPQNVEYKILKTTEMDAYDPVATSRPKSKKKSRKKS